MAIKTFKEILENKGYRIDSNDRQIFENGSIESFFGLSGNDVIEFIVYDSNDNQLPQKNYGNVRYIPLTIENIGDYFLIAEGTLFQKYQFPNEYFIDAERLLKDAGYTNGTFKTQITLLNKRVGSNDDLNKLWISEISPSRTEIRLFPNTKGSEIYMDLKERFKVLITDGNFREDVAKSAISFVEKITPITISNFLKAKYSDVWFAKFRSEYKIENFEGFCTNIHNKFLEACINEFTGRISDINDINYGKHKNIKQSITLKKSDVKLIVEHILVSVLNKYLMYPDVKFGSRKVAKLESVDTASDILQSKNSDLEINTASPMINRVIKKTANQTTENLTLDKAILEEVKDKPLPKIIQPIGYEGGGGYRGGGGRIDGRGYEPGGQFDSQSLELQQQNYL
jgi:hypothetical protein